MGNSFRILSPAPAVCSSTVWLAKPQPGNVCRPAHKVSVNSTSTHMCKIYAPVHWTVLPLMLYTNLAPFRNQPKNLLKPPEGIGSDKTQGRKSLFVWALLTTAEETQRSQLFAGHYISGLAPSAAFLRKRGCCPVVPLSTTGKRTVSLLCQRVMECFSLKNTKFPSPDIEGGPFQHLPHKLCYHTGYYFAFGVNSWVCIFLAHQPHQ